MSEGKKITVSYYNLKEEKYFNDGSSVLPSSLLRKITLEENNMFTVETVDENDKRIFWVNDDEVEFVEEKKEFWSNGMLEQQEKEINNTWFKKED